MVKIRQEDLLIRGLPPGLRDRFKATCALKHKTMRTKILELIKEFVQKNGKETNP